MKYWFDTEFIENGETIDLISIGIVAEDGRHYYAINDDCDFSKASDWVKENVLIHLPPRFKENKNGLKYRHPEHKYKEEIKEAILEFCDPQINGKPEFWAYYADYDWVAFCQLFGTMTDLPKGYPMYCRDIKQWCDQLGNPSLKRRDTNEHHALADAYWAKDYYYFLSELSHNLEKVNSYLDNREPEHFTNALTDRELKEISFSQEYARHYGHGTTGHNQYMLIAKLATILYNLQGPGNRVIDLREKPIL